MRPTGTGASAGAEPAIRRATVEDAAELARLRWDFRTEHGTSATWSYEEFLAAFQDFARDALGGSAWRAWVAEADGRSVGCVWLQLVERVPHPGLRRWERPIAYVTSMYVEPSMRNAGLGRRLLDEAVAFSRAAEVDDVILFPTEASLAFYRRAGFATDGAPLHLPVAGD